MTSNESSPRNPTIRDVAEKAEVSIATVSNVLNGGRVVSDERRKAVMAAVEALGYMPNGVAQSLRRRQSRVVGLLATGAASAYFAALLEAFEDRAASLGYEVMQVLSRDDPELELRRVRAMLARKVDGLIMVPTALPAGAFDLIAATGVPAVIVDRASADPRFDYVTMDNTAAMTDATRRLVELGHRSLLYVVRSPELVTTRERMAAFQAMAGAAGVAASVIRRESGDDRLLSQIRTILAGDNPPTAIIASNSELLIALLRVLKSLAARIPDDVSVLSFDEPVWGDVMNPGLAVVRHPVQAIARSAWEILIERMESRGAASRRVVHQAEVVIRGSVSTPRR